MSRRPQYLSDVLPEINKYLYSKLGVVVLKIEVGNFESYEKWHRKESWTQMKKRQAAEHPTARRRGKP